MFAGCKHVLTSTLAAKEALGESGDRSVGGDCQTRQRLGGQHTEVAAPQTLNTYGFSPRHAVILPTNPCVHDVAVALNLRRGNPQNGEVENLFGPRSNDSRATPKHAAAWLTALTLLVH
jgi:hypothetical protein